MKKWSRTTFDWTSSMQACGVETDILVTDWHEENVKLWHKIHGMSIYSLPNHYRAILRLWIQRVAIVPTDQREAIFDRLRHLFGGRRRAVVDRSSCGHWFEVSYTLFDDEQFCEAAIDIAREVFRAFGVSDPVGYRLASFTVVQQTFVWSRERWVDFAGWLRQKYGLPVVVNVETAEINKAFVLLT